MGDVGLMGMHVPGMSWRDTRDAAVLGEELGYRCITMGESWGEDALTSLAQLAAVTSRIRIGTRGIGNIKAVSVVLGGRQSAVGAGKERAMVSKSVAFLLADLGVTKAHSRPYVWSRPRKCLSNDTVKSRSADAH